MFLRRPRRVLERSFILEEVWGYDFPTTANSLEVYVGYLRRKTEAEGEPRLIHTVRGVGYVLKEGERPAVTAALALPPVAGQPGHPADHDGGRPGRGVRRASVPTSPCACRCRTHPRRLPARARQGAPRPCRRPRCRARYRVPSWLLGAADVRIAFLVYEDGIVLLRRPGAPPRLRCARARGRRGDRKTSIRTIADGGGYRFRSRCPTLGAGPRDRDRPVAEPQEQRAQAARAGDAAVRRRRRDRRRPRRLGGRPQRPAAGPPAHHAARRSPAPRTSRPIPVEGDDEIARLATAFNQMLTALAASRDRQRRLVADAGHELRTPLTSLRTNLDLLTQADAGGGLTAPPEARAELLDDVRAQIEELTT
jgi:hypothetical protein